MVKSQQTTKKYKDNPLYSIYGARHSKDGTRVNVTLVTGKDDNKSYASISIKKDSGKLVIKDGAVWLKVNFLKDKKDTPNDDTPF